MQATKEFLSLINQHQNIIHKVCNLYMHDATAREDLFQEITLQAWNAYKSFRGDAKFSTWPVFESAYEFPDQPEETNEIEEQMQAMYQAIGALSKIDKALVMLYLEDYSYDEIGSMLGITANNVAVKMNRIKTKLKEESKKHYQFS